MSVESIIAGFEADAAALAPSYESVSSAEIYAHLAEFLPALASRIVDIGAGTGRDAAWFAAQGHDVLAVEPTAGLREAGRALHRSPRIRWLDDRLPDLERVMARGETFDRVMLCGVWQHLTEGERRTAMAKLAALTAPGGFVILSLRHGPGPSNRPWFPCFPARAEDTISAAEAWGLSLAFKRDTESVHPLNRAAGVTRTWLVFGRGAHG